MDMVKKGICLEYVYFPKCFPKNLTRVCGNDVGDDILIHTYQRFAGFAWYRYIPSNMFIYLFTVRWWLILNTSIYSILTVVFENILNHPRIINV